MTQTAHYLIIGQGKIGSQVSNSLAKHGYFVTGMARGVYKKYSLSSEVGFLQANALEVTAQQLNKFTHIAIIVTPSEMGESGYRESYLAISEHIARLQADLSNIQQLVFISSTGVYGQRLGEWIDEQTLPENPVSITSQIIYQSEQVLQSAFGDKCVIIRPSGIYGKDRLMRIRKAKEQNKIPMAKYAWTNRIMDTDLINIITQVLMAPNPKSLYLATDYQSCTSFELTKWLSDCLHTEPPTINENIDCSGKRIHSNIPLGWLEYPDWKSGYQMILKSLS